MKVVWTEHALACLTEIEDFIAQDKLKGTGAF